MIRLLATIFVLLVPLQGAAQEPHGLVRTKLATQGRIWSGQQVVVAVELLAPGYFAGNPAFDLPGLPGVLVCPPEGSPLVSQEDLNNVTYTIQRHEIRVYAQAGGKVTLPPFEVRFQYKRQPLDQELVAEAVKTQKVDFEVVRPPGVPAGQFLISSADLTVKETWQPEPGSTAKPGDAFVRILEWSASDVTGMAFPPLDPEPVAGLGLYPSDPAVNDTWNRGSLQGGRTDKVTYVVKSSGQTVIPGRRISWWDPVAERLKSQNLPAHPILVTAPPPPPLPPGARIAEYWRDHRRAILLSLAGTLALVTVVWHNRPFWKQFLRQLLPRHLGPLNPP